MSKPKIFFLSIMNGAAWGGSEELWYQSALWTAKHHFEVAVCCYDWEEKKEKLNKLSKAGCKLYLLPGKEKERKRKFSFRPGPSKTIKNIPFELYDLVVINQGGWKDLAYPPFQQLHTRLKNFIILFHNYNQKDKLAASKKNSLEQWVKKSRLNLAATKRIFDTMEETYDVQVPRAGKFFNPVTISVPGKATEYPPLKNKNYKFSVLAALDIDRKAQDVLIHSLSGKSWKSKNWELHLYGEGKDKEYLQKLVYKLGMEEKIFIHGNARNYRHSIEASHLILQITHIDAMPLSVIEAMAMARPIVVSNVGDMPLWIKEGVNGWICDEVEKNSISKVLEQAWDHRAKWEEMGIKSYLFYKDKFPQDPVAYFLEQIKIT